MRSSQIMQQHTGKRSSWTLATAVVLALLLAGNFGCAHIRHHLREHSVIGDLVQRHQGDYYHCPHCGKIIPGKDCDGCPNCTKVPSFHGYEPTCWRQFPQGWGCEPEHASQSEFLQEGMLETELEAEVIESIPPAADPVPETEIRSSGDLDADSASKPTLPVLKDPMPFTVKASQKPAATTSTAPAKTKPAPAVTTAKAAKQPTAVSSKPAAAKPSAATVSKATTTARPNAAAVANKPSTQVDVEARKSVAPAAKPKLSVDTPKVAHNKGTTNPSAAARSHGRERVARPLRKILPRDEKGPIPVRKVKSIIDLESEDQIYSLSDQQPGLERRNTPPPKVSSEPTVLKIPTPPADVEGKTYTFSDQHPKPVRRIPSKQPTVRLRPQPKLENHHKADGYFPAPVRRIQLTRYHNNN